MLEPNSNYFENLAKKCVPIAHSDSEKAFFEIENPDELNNFDEALRSMVKDNCMLLVHEGGELDDATSENHTDTLEFQIYILKLKRENNTVTSIRTECKNILVEVVKRIKQDFKLTSTNKYRFRISNYPYQKVGPMGPDNNWFGYTTVIRFICPFSAVVNVASWSDLSEIITP